MKIRESDKPKMRKCLSCQKDFLSAWSGNRSCSKCLKRNLRKLMNEELGKYDNNRTVKE